MTSPTSDGVPATTSTSAPAASTAASIVVDVLARGPFALAAWDFDGALSDTEPVQREGYVRLLRARGIEPAPDFFEACLGRTEGEIWELLSGTYGLTELTTALREERMSVFLALAAERLRPSGIATALLPALRASGARQVVVSSGNVEVIEPLLERWGIRSEFDEILAWSPAVTTTKRERLAAAVAEASPALAIEDDRGYLAYARSLGAVTLGVRHSMNRLTAGDADLLADIDPTGSP